MIIGRHHGDGGRGARQQQCVAGARDLDLRRRIRANVQREGRWQFLQRGRGIGPPLPARAAFRDEASVHRSACHIEHHASARIAGERRRRQRHRGTTAQREHRTARQHQDTGQRHILIHAAQIRRIARPRHHIAQIRLVGHADAMRCTRRAAIADREHHVVIEHRQRARPFRRLQCHVLRDDGAIAFAHLEREVRAAHATHRDHGRRAAQHETGGLQFELRQQRAPPGSDRIRQCHGAVRPDAGRRDHGDQRSAGPEQRTLSHVAKLCVRLRRARRFRTGQRTGSMRRGMRAKRTAFRGFRGHTERAAAHLLLMLDRFGNGVRRGAMRIHQTTQAPHRDRTGDRRDPEQERHDPWQNQPPAATEQRDAHRTRREDRQRDGCKSCVAREPEQRRTLVTDDGLQLTERALRNYWRRHGCRRLVTA